MSQETMTSVLADIPGMCQTLSKERHIYLIHSSQQMRWALYPLEDIPRCTETEYVPVHGWEFSSHLSLLFLPYQR